VDHRQLVRALAAGRVAVGAALTVAPGLTGRTWIGPVARQREVKVVVRAMGGRDLAMGLGTLQALERGGDVRSWVVLSAACDAVDTAATLLAIRRLGPRAVPVLLTAAAAAVAGAASADHLA
jgi:hypothetical protein